MNQLHLSNSDNYDYGESTLTRDSQVYTSSAVPGELSKLMENVVVIVDLKRDGFFIPSLDFTFQPFHVKAPSAPVVRINTLPDNRYSLKKPIEVVVSYEEEEFKAEIPELELYAFADNEEETVREVLLDLVDLCDDLLDIPDGQLGKYPRKWKSILESMIRVDVRKDT